MENAIRCKPEVEIVSQTGSTIKLATETRNRNVYTYVFGSEIFTGVLANLTRRFIYPEIQR